MSGKEWKRFDNALGKSLYVGARFGSFVVLSCSRKDDEKSCLLPFSDFLLRNTGRDGSLTPSEAFLPSWRAWRLRPALAGLGAGVGDGLGNSKAGAAFNGTCFSLP
ncbi:hypothetical protein E2C01_010591 [Portunus trituberculatus]|uniref:Uncharacterized protein n=1 Tax=Portunus trituberculatus TaxID=210409 RepID=A0A5B7D8T0_PORTR|nr:hypothetical protein [Portunus trituberculatus]